MSPGPAELHCHYNEVQKEKKMMKISLLIDQMMTFSILYSEIEKAKPEKNIQVLV